MGNFKMALINCPECGKAFSDKAVACPNCAYPLTDMDRIRFGIIDGKVALEKADLYYSEEKYQLALEIYLAVTERDNSEACFKAGSMLCNGYGTDIDSDKGLALLEKAAAKNYSDAIFFLGCFYDSNNKTEKALEYFSMCLEKANSFEKEDLSHIYYRLGCLLPVDFYPEKKKSCLKKALEMGISRAQQELAQAYFSIGRSAYNQNNLDAAIENLIYSVDYNCEEAKILLSDCYYKKSLSCDTEEKNLYLIKASKLGNQEAKSVLGQHYLQEGLQENNTEILEQASNLGNQEAAEKLGDYYNRQGTLYFNGDGVEKDLETAEKFFIRAAELDNASAKKNLSVLYNHIGIYYYNGTEEINPDFIKAEKFFSKAAEYGNENSLENLGIIYNQYGLQYQNGDGVQKNYETAEEFYLKAIKCGNEESTKNLITTYVNCYFNYRHGINGYIKDKQKAAEYLKKARETSPDLLREFAEEYKEKALKMMNDGITHKNYKRVNSYLKRAARLGAEDVTDRLIFFYKTVSKYYKKGKNGFDKDSSRANHYMRKAAELGDSEALKKYKPKKQHKNIIKNTFENITGTSTIAIKKASTKGNYNYYYNDYDD